MAARHEQIGQRASDEQAMEVLVQPPIAHLGKAEHPLNDPDRMFDPSPHFGFGAVFRTLDRGVAPAAVDRGASAGVQVMGFAGGDARLFATADAIRNLLTA